MEIKLGQKSVVVFDLDDTLYPELDFLRSGYRAAASLLSSENSEQIAQQMLEIYSENPNNNVFQIVLSKLSSPTHTIESLLKCYRTHKPQLSLPQDSAALLQRLSTLQVPLALITDGRSITQRNKIESLGIEKYFSSILISEETGFDKHSPENFLDLQRKFPNSTFFFIADNTQKDFVHPNALGWTTICLLDSGHNIHAQDFERCSALPQLRVNSLSELSFVR